MALKTRTRLYEILVRFGPEGFQGAHAIDIEEIVDGETVKAATEFPARAVTEAEVGDIIGKQAAKLIEAVDAANGRAEASRVQAAGAEESRLAAVKDAANWQERAEDLAARIARRAELDALKAAAAEAQAMVTKGKVSAIAPTATVVGNLPPGSEVGEHSVVITRSAKD